jgi:hypothetical protein
MCETEVNAIEIGNEIAEDQERAQSLYDLADRTLFYILHGILPLVIWPSAESSGRFLSVITRLGQHAQQCLFSYALTRA